jgi:curved DNA-binding protein CbpA
MARQSRSNDWGFPRWRAYDSAGKAAEAVRRCDRAGCGEPGTCPAPKAPDRPERWYFCPEHAAEYNQRWNYFDAASREERAAAEEAERRAAGGWQRARHWDWGEGDGSRSQAELDALRLFDLPPDAEADAVKAAHRRMAKANHPDLHPGDEAAAARFRAAQAAYEVLRAADDRRAAAGAPRQG